MAKKKSRRHRGPREARPAAVVPQPQSGGEPQESVAPASGEKAVSASAIAPKASVLRPSGNPSHNLGLELRMIAIFGGGAIAILALLSLVQPTTVVADWLHL
jgi:hypothetical protein